jgi:hypothetical protein
MADNPDTHPPVVAIPVSDAHCAPFIFFENVAAFGHTNGVISLTLSANRTLIGSNGTVINKQIITAHLRGNIPAAIALRDALNQALLLATPVAEGKPN